MLAPFAAASTQHDDNLSTRWSLAEWFELVGAKNPAVQNLNIHTKQISPPSLVLGDIICIACGTMT